MEANNVCKFNFNHSSDLICKNFIYETQNMQSTLHRAERYGICLAADGSGTFTCGKTRYPLTAGTLFFCVKGETVAIESVEDLKYYYIQFHGRRAEEYMQRLGIHAENCFFEGYDALIPFWQECNTLADEGNIDIFCEAVLLYSLAKLRPVKKESYTIVEKMIALTQECFTDHNLSVTTMASEFGYNSKYLSSMFKKKKGISYTQYLQELRIRHAIFLIEEGAISVKNVALLSGFRDALYFSKVFTKTEGISPKSYMQAVAQRNTDQTDALQKERQPD